MSVSLTPELAAWVRARVDSGRWGTASEVMREALRCLQDREASTAHVRNLIEQAYQSSLTSEGIDADEAFRSIRQHLADRVAEGS